jgi:hypothetical protein
MSKALVLCSRMGAPPAQGQGRHAGGLRFLWKDERNSHAARGAMKELLRTNDAVLITAVEALLKGAGIECLVADRYMSVMEGSIGILPRRLMIDDDEADKARQILTEAGLGHALPPD